MNQLTYASDQQLVDEISRRKRLLNWLQKSVKTPRNLTRSFVSPSTTVETWDCRTELQILADVERAAESLLTLNYNGNKIEPIV